MSDQRGFTLLEVMIATAVAAVAIVSALQLFSGSMHLAGRSARQTEALVLARSLVDETMWRAELVEDRMRGHEGVYDWRITVRRIERTLRSFEEEPGLGLDSDADYELMEIYAEVSWGGLGAGHVELVTARLTEVF